MLLLMVVMMVMAVVMAVDVDGDVYEGCSPRFADTGLPWQVWKL